MFFDGWQGIVRMAIFGSAAYVCAILMLRISGSRTLSKMSAFDLVITIAFGSRLSAILVDESLRLVTGIAALAMLVGLQYIVAALAVRFTSFSAIVVTPPGLLVWDGRFLREAMRKQRVTRDDIQAALRKRGFSDLSQVLAVVLEADGSMSVVEASGQGIGKFLDGVAGTPDCDQFK